MLLKQTPVLCSLPYAIIPAPACFSTIPLPPPFRWDEDRRFLLYCELDAAYFHLYGIERDDVDYIMETGEAYETLLDPPPAHPSVAHTSAPPAWAE